MSSSVEVIPASKTFAWVVTRDGRNATFVRVHFALRAQHITKKATTHCENASDANRSFIVMIYQHVTIFATFVVSHIAWIAMMKRMLDALAVITMTTHTTVRRFVMNALSNANQMIVPTCSAPNAPAISIDAMAARRIYAT